MKKILNIGFLLIANQFFFAQSTPEQFTFPAEFEKQDAVWMTWCDVPAFAGKPIGDTSFEIIKQLVPYVRVNLLVTDDLTRTVLQSRLLRSQIDTSRIHLIVYRNPWFNLRDPGPIFLKGDQGHLKIADIKFNVFGLLESTDDFAVSIDTIDIAVARMLKLPVHTAKIAGEGGGREFNGKGTMMVVESTEMSRNKGMTRNDIERELLTVFGQKKIIWLKKGPIHDEETTYGKLPGNIYPNGVNHIDEFCRFVTPNTILLAEIAENEAKKDSLNIISHERLKTNFELLKSATDQDGKAFKIIRMPMAETITATFKIANIDKYSQMYFIGSKPGETITYILATSYLNFLITNNAVLMPSYWKEGRSKSIKRKDRKARKIMEKVFPERKIIQINVEELNHGGGGIHCATQQQPSLD